MILKLILVGLALFGVYAWLGAFWRRRFTFEPGYERIHLVRTGDACRIALYRYPPGCKRHEIPVLLCHGLAANRFNFDLGPGVSLARYLQQKGFDVWSVDLRGRGISGSHARGSANDGAHVFDDYVRQDAVAAIRHVRAETGASQVHWIGHSMGGLVLYGVLQGEESESIASGVAIASPASFEDARRIPLVYFLFLGLRYLPRVHLRFLAAGLAPLLARIRLPWEGIFLNRDNAEVTPIQRALCYLVSDISRGEVLQFLDWMRGREFRTYDGVHSYEQNLAHIRQPLFLIAGSKDLLVPPNSVAVAFDQISSTRKEFLILGREQGQQEDYGHGDLLVGKNSSREVFPLILQWLESVDAGQSPS